MKTTPKSAAKPMKQSPPSAKSELSSLVHAQQLVVIRDMVQLVHMVHYCIVYNITYVRIYVCIEVVDVVCTLHTLAQAAHHGTHTHTFTLSSGKGLPTVVVNAMLLASFGEGGAVGERMCVCVSACRCVLSWLGVKKEVKPVKGAEGRKAEAKTKLVPAKRQPAKKGTATVSTHGTDCACF